MLKTKPYDSSNWTLNYIDSPFELYKLSNVFTENEFVDRLCCCLEKLPFNYNANDIFSFSQSNDFSALNINNKKFQPIKSFLSLLNDLRSLFSKLFNFPLDEKISVSSSAYKRGDYLLCHDDRSEDRAVAFIYYLNKDWDSKWGGSLDLFASDDRLQPTKVVRQVYPEHNTLIFFKVGNRTYHQVSEILASNTRLSINGWFHSSEVLISEQLRSPVINLHFRNIITLSGTVYLSNMVQNILLRSNSLQYFNDLFQENNVIMIPNFLKSQVYDALNEELRSNVHWKLEGHPNQRRYYVGDVCDAEFAKCLIHVFSSSAILAYFSSITDSQNTESSKVEHEYAKVHIELQKWEVGCYSMASVQVEEQKTPSLDVFLFFGADVARDTSNADSSIKNSANCSGMIYYYTEGCSGMNREIDPCSGSLCIAYREANERWFCSYIARTFPYTFYALHASYYTN